MAPAHELSPSVDDRLARALGIPAFGVGIPLLFGLYGSLPWSSPRWWAGQLVFVSLAAALWHGNRALLFTTASRFDWLERPWRRVLRLVAGVVLFTVPVTAVVLVAWFRLGLAQAVDWSAVRAVTLMNVICVVFVAHVYETVLLLKARQADALRLVQAQRAQVESELLALRRQVDPHFLFNCLNTLQALMAEDVPRALRFNQSLAAMLRYLLDTADRQVVTLEDELTFAGRYAELLILRYGAALQVELPSVVEAARGKVLPPTAVQLLLENALAHNRLSTKEPLEVTVRVEPDAVIVSHPHRPKADSAGTGTGLKNLAERLERCGAGALEVRAAGGAFTVRVPLVEARVP